MSDFDRAAARARADARRPRGYVDQALVSDLRAALDALYAAEATIARCDQRPYAEGDGDTRCRDCGRRNFEWYAPHRTWNFVMGGPAATDDPGGVVCPVCFMSRAEAVGVTPASWRLAPVDADSDLFDAYRERNEAREERDALRATIARVRALAEEWASRAGPNPGAHPLMSLSLAHDRIFAALDRTVRRDP